MTVGIPAGLLGMGLGDEVRKHLFEKGLDMVRDGSITLGKAFEWLPYLNDRTLISNVTGLALGAAGFVVGAAVVCYAQRAAQTA
jgi:hypothetical protein